MDARPLRLAPALLLPAILCFFLPFAQFTSFPDMKPDHLMARDFLLGPSLHLGTYPNEDPLRLEPDPSMTVAVPVMIAALILAFLPGRRNQIATSVLAGIAGGALLHMQSGFAWAMVDVYWTVHHIPLGDLRFVITYEPAYYVLVCLLAVTAAASLPFGALVRLSRAVHIPRDTLKRTDKVTS
jgi:hypothetical protein